MRHFLTSVRNHSENVPKCIFIHCLRLPHLLHRMDADNGVAGHSWVGRNYVHLGFHSDGMEHPSSSKMLGLIGRQFCSPLVSPSKAAAGNLMPENRASMFFSQEAASCLYRAGSVVFASKIHTTSSFQQGCKPSLPHLLGMSVARRKSPSSPPPHTPPSDASQCALSTGPIL